MAVGSISLLALLLAAGRPVRAEQPYNWDYRSASGVAFSTRAEAECAPLAVDPAPFGDTRYQGKMGWCYAYATSDLLTYCMKTERLSAADIAYNNARSQWQGGSLESFLDIANRGGVPWEAFADLQRRQGSVCPERFMTSDAESFSEVSGSGGESLYDQYTHGTFELIEKFIKLREEYDDSKAKNGQGTLSCADPNGSNSGCFSHLSKARPDVFGDAAFLDMLAKTSPVQYVDEIPKRLCENHRLPIPADCSYITAWGAPPSAGHVLFQDVDGQLRRGNPVEFAANSHFLNGTDGVEAGGDPHAMVLLQRRYLPAADDRPAGCYYQVRNSWGADCSGYSKFVHDCDSKTGYFWVSEGTLDRNMIFVNYFGR